MAVWRIRTEIDDRPGRLAALSTALAAAGGNILNLEVHVAPGGVIDEFVVEFPASVSAAHITACLADAGGRRITVVPASRAELVDHTTAALLVAAKLHTDPRSLPHLLGELLRADDATWVYGPDANAPSEDHTLIVPAGPSRAVRLIRRSLPFTLTEAARADALISFLLPLATDPVGHPLTLPDFARLTVRPLRDDDFTAVREMHRRCSPLTRRGRYFLARRNLTARMWQAFCDRERGITLVAESDRGVVALAHLVYTPDPGVGEIAILVEDAWQSRRLGTELTWRLLTLARSRGLAELRAHLLADNRRMRRILTRLGAVIESGPGLILEARLPVVSARLNRSPLPATPQSHHI